MTVWNIRGVPDELARTVKSTAAARGVTLTDLVIGTMGREMGAAESPRKKIADDSAGVVGENPACAPMGKREYGDYFPVIDTTPVEDKGKVLAELRGLVAGIENNVLITPTMGADGNFEAQEVDLCWRKEYNPDTGQTGACGLEKGHKGKCGAWEVVE
jgi:hypothetical protein